MSSKGFISSMLSIFFKLRTKYDQISQDENKKAKTAYFGAYSIATAIVTSAFFVLGIWGLMTLSNSLDGQGLGEIVIYVLIGIIVLVEIVIFLQYIFGGLLGIYYQLKCNRTAIGWVALGIYIVITVGAAVGIVFIASMMQ